ncbi:MAG TPA: hypothetical protein VGR47_22450 [Terracidiphilus sp.]|nr:hypothetical protein [Terracidiphilus sp.]
MIEPEDFMIQGISALHTTSALDRAAAETIAARLSELRLRPVLGAYDSSHLQQIHARVFQDLFPWAGQFREPHSPSLASSLDMLFDRLARENRLKGLDGDAWSKRSSEYFSELSAIEPFIDGNELALLELFRQLASENNMTLCCVNGMSEPNPEELRSQLRRTQSNNLRRILMLAVDPDPTVRASRVLDGPNMFELVPPT